MTDFKSETEVAQLVRLGGPRSTPSGERALRARQRVHAHWRQSLEHRPRYPLALRTAALAACLITVIGVGTWVWRAVPFALVAPVAIVDRLAGEVTVDDRPLEPGAALAPGSRLRSGHEGRVSLRLSGGQSLRLDTDTRLTLAGAHEVALAQGGIYVDSGADALTQSVQIHTDWGEVRDIGTQFLVRTGQERLTVAVREGLVQINSAPDQLSVEAGERILLADGTRQRDAISADDAVWDWAEEMAPRFELEGASLHRFLNWFARERGLKLRWRDARSERVALETRLSGDLEGLSLEDSLAMVRRTAPFLVEREGDLLWVELP